MTSKSRGFGFCVCGDSTSLRLAVPTGLDPWICSEACAAVYRGQRSIEILACQRIAAWMRRLREERSLLTFEDIVEGIERGKWRDEA